MKCVVTGGAGFIGSNIVEELVNQGDEVIVVDNLATGNRNNLADFKDKVTFIEGSIMDLQLLQKVFSGVDYVFHQAAVPSVSKSIENPKPTNDVNITGTLHVLIAARDNTVRKVVSASSSSVYGDTPTLPKVETMQPNPISPYALTKFVGEQYCKQFSKHYGLGTVCLRYFNVFGPRQSPKSQYAAVIPKFIDCVQKEVQPPIHGDGNQTRDFTFVKDVVNANILAAKSDVSDGTPINIAYNNSISVNKLLGIINKIIGKDVKGDYGDPRPGDIRDSKAGVDKAKDLLGYNPNPDLERDIGKTIEWFSKQ